MNQAWVIISYQVYGEVALKLYLCAIHIIINPNQNDENVLVAHATSYKLRQNVCSYPPYGSVDVLQTKNIKGPVAYKKIQGGVQPDMSLRITSNFSWKRLSLTLRPYRCTSKKQLPFRVEEKHGSKEWTEQCQDCHVQPWKHKCYTSVRVQFCREYFGTQLEFLVRGQNNVNAATKLPFIVLPRYEPRKGTN